MQEKTISLNKKERSWLNILLLNDIIEHQKELVQKESALIDHPCDITRKNYVYVKEELEFLEALKRKIK